VAPKLDDGRPVELTYLLLRISHTVIKRQRGGRFIRVASRRVVVVVSLIVVVVDGFIVGRYHEQDQRWTHQTDQYLTTPQLHVLSTQFTYCILHVLFNGNAFYYK